MDQPNPGQYRIYWSKQTIPYDDFDKAIEIVSRMENLLPRERLDGPYSRMAMFVREDPNEAFDLVFDENYGLYLRATPTDMNFQAHLLLLVEQLDSEIASW